MLRIIERPRFSCTVDVDTPHVQGSFRVDYVGFPRSQQDELIKRGEQECPDVGILAWVVCGFEPVELPDGQRVVFDGLASLRRLADWPGIVPAMISRYYRGQWESALGNFERRPDGSSDQTTRPQTAASTTTPTPPSA